MEITSNYQVQNSKVNLGLKNQNFKGNSDNTVAQQNQITKMSAITPDYNVKVPMGYTHLQDVKLTDSLTAHCYKLANGQQVVIVPKEGTALVKSYVNTGSFNEPDNLRGISHYIEHNLFNGSEDLGDKVFFDEVSKMGASSNASTSFSKTDYYIASQLLEDSDFETNLKLHAGMLQSPKFLIDKLEKEKDIVNSEINMYMSEDVSVAFSKTIKNLFGVKSSSADLIAGTTDNVSALTRDDVVNYYKSNYYPANMVTVITADVDPEDTMKLVSKYFTAKNQPVGARHFEKLTPINKPVREDLISKKSTGATSIFMGFAGPENNNAVEAIHMKALNYLLLGIDNSRFSDIERKYGVSIDISPERLSSRPEDKTLYAIGTSVTEAKSEKLIQEMYNVLNSFVQNPPTEEEMTVLKTRLKKMYDEGSECSFVINGRVANGILNGTFDTVNKHNEIIDKMTAQDLVNVAKKYYDLNKVALTVVHPSTTTKENIMDSHRALNSVSFTGAMHRVPFDINKVSHYKTENNYEVAFVDTDSNNVEAKINIEEKVWTPKEAAISSVLSDILQNAGTTTKTEKEFARQKDLLALDSSVRANQYGLCLKAIFPADKAKESLDLLQEKIMNPNITQETFDAAVNRLRDVYQDAQVSAYDKFDKAMYPNLPLAFDSKDKLASLDKITLDDVKAYYNSIFKNTQASVVVAGPVNKNPELKQTVFNSVAKYPQAAAFDKSLVKVYKPIEKTEVHTAVDKKNQAKILEGFKFEVNNNIKDMITLTLLNEVLGGSTSSRLFSDLREKRHLAYHVDSGFSIDDNIGVLTLTIGTTTENQETGENTYDNIKKSIDGFNENIEKMKNEKVTKEELDAAKKAVKTSLLNSTEYNVDKVYSLFDEISSVYGANRVNLLFDSVDAITPEDIQNAAKYIFNTKPVYSMTMTQATLDANKDYLETLKK